MTVTLQRLVPSSSGRHRRLMPDLVTVIPHPVLTQGLLIVAPKNLQTKEMPPINNLLWGSLPKGASLQYLPPPFTQHICANKHKPLPAAAVGLCMSQPLVPTSAVPNGNGKAQHTPWMDLKNAFHHLHRGGFHRGQLVSSPAQLPQSQDYVTLRPETSKKGQDYCLIGFLVSIRAEGKPNAKLTWKASNICNNKWPIYNIPTKEHAGRTQT